MYRNPNHMTAKKSSVKKVGSGTKGGARAKRVLARAEGPQCFWVHDGSILADLVEFEQALESMSADVFAHHTSKTRNDFADWVAYVLGDTELSEKLRAATTPKKARSVVVQRLKIYQL